MPDEVRMTPIQRDIAVAKLELDVKPEVKTEITSIMAQDTDGQFSVEDALKSQAEILNKYPQLAGKAQELMTAYAGEDGVFTAEELLAAKKKLAVEADKAAKQPVTNPNPNDSGNPNQGQGGSGIGNFLLGFIKRPFEIVYNTGKAIVTTAYNLVTNPRQGLRDLASLSGRVGEAIGYAACPVAGMVTTGANALGSGLDAAEIAKRLQTETDPQKRAELQRMLGGTTFDLGANAASFAEYSRQQKLMDQAEAQRERAAQELRDQIEQHNRDIAQHNEGLQRLGDQIQAHNDLNAGRDAANHDMIRQQTNELGWGMKNNLDSQYMEHLGGGFEQTYGIDQINQTIGGIDNFNQQGILNMDTYIHENLLGFTPLDYTVNPLGTFNPNLTSLGTDFTRSAMNSGLGISWSGAVLNDSAQRERRLQPQGQQ